MSYDINGDGGNFVAGGPSIGGLSELKQEIAARINPKLIPNVVQFLNDGHSSNPSRLKYEFQAVAKQVKSPTVKKTCLEIAKAAGKCKDVVILHNHIQ